MIICSISDRNCYINVFLEEWGNYLIPYFIKFFIGGLRRETRIRTYGAKFEWRLIVRGEEMKLHHYDPKPKRQ